MKRKLIKGSLALLIGLGIAYGITQVPDASASYRVVKRVKQEFPFPDFHQKNRGTNVYLWNLSHTKRLHNMKNYPRTTWSRIQTVILQSGQKKGVYYQISNGHANGYVWRGYLTSGKNPTASYVQNSDVNVLYSSIAKKDWNKVNSAENYTYAKPNLTGISSYASFAKKPTTAQINKVVAFIKATNKAEGITGTGTLTASYKGWQNFRIVMRPVASTKSLTMIPFVEYMDNHYDDIGTGYDVSGNEWYSAGSFQAFYDAATAKSSKSYDSTTQPGPTGDIIYTPVSYVLPSYSLMRRYPYNRADKIYTLKKGSLSVVQNGLNLAYIKTTNILKFPNRFQYRSGIAYGLTDPTRTTLTVDTKKATHYRYIDTNMPISFTDFTYVNGKWQQNFYAGLLSDQTPIKIYFRRGIGGQSKNILPPYPVSQGSATADSNTLKILYSPESLWHQY
ncbi:hypothetical protein [Secundilactobacillus kimchicus]|nr:hypothetical protein [Secundilactobacillus kimchicus]